MPSNATQPTAVNIVAFISVTRWSGPADEISLQYLRVSKNVANARNCEMGAPISPRTYGP
jgi:hypothetical protein